VLLKEQEVHRVETVRSFQTWAGALQKTRSSTVFSLFRGTASSLVSTVMVSGLPFGKYMGSTPCWRQYETHSRHELVPCKRHDHQPLPNGSPDTIDSLDTWQLVVRGTTSSLLSTVMVSGLPFGKYMRSTPCWRQYEGHSRHKLVPWIRHDHQPPAVLFVIVISQIETLIPDI